MSDDVIIAFLLSYPGVSDLVATRGYPYGVLPQKKKNGAITSEMPAFTVSVWENESSHSITADKQRDEPRFIPARFQIDVYALTGRIAHILSETIRDILDGFNGAMSNHTIGFCGKRSVSNITRNPETLLFHRLMDFEMHVMN